MILEIKVCDYTFTTSCFCSGAPTIECHVLVFLQCAGVHEVTLCKDAKGRCGISLHPVNKGIFVCFIQRDSPAALSGLRFGDQILLVRL